jgi:hypothetical protein
MHHFEHRCLRACSRRKPILVRGTIICFTIRSVLNSNVLQHLVPDPDFPRSLLALVEQLAAQKLLTCVCTSAPY